MNELRGPLALFFSSFFPFFSPFLLFSSLHHSATFYRPFFSTCPLFFHISLPLFFLLCTSSPLSSIFFISAYYFLFLSGFSVLSSPSVYLLDFPSFSTLPSFASHLSFIQFPSVCFSLSPPSLLVLTPPFPSITPGALFKRTFYIKCHE